MVIMKLPPQRVFRFVASLIFFWIARCDRPGVWIVVAWIVVVVPGGGIRVGLLVRGYVGFLVPIPVRIPVVPFDPMATLCEC